MLSNNFKVVDNFLEQQDFIALKNALMSFQFPWYYNDSVSTLENEPFYYFTHLFYCNYRITSDFFELIEPIIQKINPKAIIRIKANLNTKLFTKAENAFHLDYGYPNSGAIFYVNDNDGNTVIKDLNNNEVEIKPIENRMLFFNPEYLHKSTHPTNSKRRVNINFNYII